MATAEHKRSAERIALAEKLLAERIAEVMANAAREIEELCQLTIQELLVKLRPDELRGPEPRVHCVILAAKVPGNGDSNPIRAPQK